MDVEAFLNELRRWPEYAGQIVYLRRVPARQAAHATTAAPLPAAIRQMLAARGIDRLYAHQAEAIDCVREGKNVLVVTGTASGKSLCYTVPIAERLLADPGARALLVYPTKALCQDQFRTFSSGLAAAGVGEVLSGVYDGDTPGSLRRKLRDQAAVIFTNPDMLHAAMMASHGRWGGFLASLKFLVIDELHTYSGIFGANMTNLLRRLWRICRHYGSDPRIVACSATIANPKELAEGLTGRDFVVIDRDGSPRGRRTYVFWNPPRIRSRIWRGRRSANVEAHALMAALITRGAATITFSKAKMTAEMIHRYVCERLQQAAPHLAGKVAPYRGGYRPAERREIERRLFAGELLGVSATRALELGIDVGALEASILVGYPGTLASFFQQSGRAGRRDRDAVVILIGLGTTVNQYVMSHPEYVFARPIERAVLDADNPFVILGHLRCAAHEQPLGDEELEAFGPRAAVAAQVLADGRKLKRIDGRWYHAAGETPQHEVSLRSYADASVLIEDAEAGEVIGQVNKFDAPPILHPEAIYLHGGQTYRVLELNLDENLARVQREEVDYYTNPLGGTDVHHVDHCLREKPFGTGKACWGEVTAYFDTWGYEKIHFYSLDRISMHRVELPTMQLETMAVWLVPPETLMEQVRRAGLDAHGGLRGIGYATRMMLPLFMTCDTLDFSHSIGSANSPWNAVFIYERYPLGLGFTETAYQRLGEIMPRVLAHVRACGCTEGCPCCVGKPLRQYATWYYDLGEASIPSKAAAVMILEGLLGDGTALDRPDAGALTDGEEADTLRLQQALRRRLQRMREPRVFHPIEPQVPTGYPAVEQAESLAEADAAVRKVRRTAFGRQLRKRLAKRIETDQLPPEAGRKGPPPGMKAGADLPPTAFPPRPDVQEEQAAEDVAPKPGEPIELGDKLAARARKLKKKRKKDT